MSTVDQVRQEWKDAGMPAGRKLELLVALEAERRDAGLPPVQPTAEQVALASEAQTRAERDVSRLTGRRSITESQDTK